MIDQELGNRLEAFNKVYSDAFTDVTKAVNDGETTSIEAALSVIVATIPYQTALLEAILVTLQVNYSNGAQAIIERAQKKK